MNFEIFDKAVPTPSALVRMTILVIVLQVIIAWGIMTTTVFTEGTPVTTAANEELSAAGISTRSVKRSAVQAHTTRAVLACQGGA